MKITPFFKLPQHKTFTYKPRYYDPEKEELMERVERTKREIGASERQTGEPYVPNLEGQLTSRFYERRAYSKRASNTRMLIILAVLAALGYFVFYF